MKVSKPTRLCFPLDGEVDVAIELLRGGIVLVQRPEDFELHLWVARAQWLFEAREVCSKAAVLDLGAESWPRTTGPHTARLEFSRRVTEALRCHHSLL